MKFKNFQLFYEADGTGAGTPPPAPADPPADQPSANKGMPNPFAGADEPPAPPPEQYEFNLAEGLTIDDELKNQFTTIAKEAKLNQAQVDSLLKMHGDIVLNMIDQANQQAETWAAQSKEAGYLTPENIGYAKTALDTFGGETAIQALVDTGAANHPAVMKMLINIGSLLSEDKPVEGAPPSKNVNAADMLFPNSKYQ